MKDKDPNLDGSDIREGLTAIISLRIPEDVLEFEGQTKGKLGTPEARNATDYVLYDKFTTFLEENRKLHLKSSVELYQHNVLEMLLEKQEMKLEMENLDKKRKFFYLEN